MIAIGITALILVILLLVYLNSGENVSGGSSSSGGSSPVSASSGITQKGGANNPGFLIHTNEKWKGKTNSDGCEFENFSTLHYGVRAWYVNLFGKVKNGTIRSTNEMIDVLTPASDPRNSPEARANYKNEVAKAKNWLELGMAVFRFEANPDWLSASESVKNEVNNSGFSEAIAYRYGPGNIPQYFS